MPRHQDQLQLEPDMAIVDDQMMASVSNPKDNVFISLMACSFLYLIVNIV